MMTVCARSVASSDHQIRQGGDAGGYRFAALASTLTPVCGRKPHTGYALLELEGMVYYMKYGTEKNV